MKQFTFIRISLIAVVIAIWYSLIPGSVAQMPAGPSSGRGTVTMIFPRQDHLLIQVEGKGFHYSCNPNTLIVINEAGRRIRLSDIETPIGPSRGFDVIFAAVSNKPGSTWPMEVTKITLVPPHSEAEKAASKIDDSDASAFVQKFLDALSCDFHKLQIQELASMYADTIDWMDRGRIGRTNVQRHLQRHIGVWTVRHWQVVGPVKTQPLPAGAEVMFSAKFEGTDWNGDVGTADAQITLILKLDSAEEIKITAHHQVMKDPSILELNHK